MNKEIVEELGGEDIVRYIKSQSISWLGQIIRCKQTRMIKQVTDWVPRKGSNGRSKDSMKVQNWRKKAKQRQEWRGIVILAQTHEKLWQKKKRWGPIIS